MGLEGMVAKVDRIAKAQEKIEDRVAAVENTQFRTVLASGGIGGALVFIIDFIANHLLKSSLILFAPVALFFICGGCVSRAPLSPPNGPATEQIFDAEGNPNFGPR